MICRLISNDGLNFDWAQHVSVCANSWCVRGNEASQHIARAAPVRILKFRYDVCCNVAVYLVLVPDVPALVYVLAAGLQDPW